jgi:hypothetical protein
MVYEVKNFSAETMQYLANDINAFFVANPTFVGVSVTLSQGAGFNALVMYAV